MYHVSVSSFETKLENRSVKVREREIERERERGEQVLPFCHDASRVSVAVRLQ